MRDKLKAIKAIAYVYGPLAVIFIIFLTGAFIGYYRGDTEFTRASVFFLVTLVLLAELFSMIGRIPKGEWDALSSSMAFLRMAVVNYIYTIMVMFTGVATFPDWWWTFSRSMMGATAAVALIFMAREDRAAWGVMSKQMKVRSILSLIIYGAAVVVVGIAW